MNLRTDFLLGVLGVGCLLSLASITLVFGSLTSPPGDQEPFDTMEIELLRLGDYGWGFCDVEMGDLLSLSPDEVCIETHALLGNRRPIRIVKNKELWNVVRSFSPEGYTRNDFIEDGGISVFTIQVELGKFRRVEIHEAATVNNLPKILKRYSRDE
jgi:hypothetical protein